MTFIDIINGSFKCYGITDIPIESGSVVLKNSNFVDNTRFINSQLAIVYVIDIITMELMEKSEYSSTMNKTVELIMDRKLSK